MRIRWLAILMLGLALLTGRARAQGTVTVTEVEVSWRFGERAIFSARVNGADVRRVTLFIQGEHEPQARSVLLSPDEDGVCRWELDLHAAAFPPFSTVRFWYGVESQAGTTLSETYSFVYADDRYPWQELTSGPLRVHWYAGDLAFGQAALDVALVTLERMQPLAAVPPGSALDVYLYASYEDLAGALGEGTAVWVGSHAYPGLSVALAVVTPGVDQRSLMEQNIPHEVMHLLLNLSTGGRADRLPAWLREGLASQAEVIPDPGYAQALRAARDEGAILPLSELCVAFPPDSGRAYLAYAEADSFVRYLRGRFGDQAMRQLIQVYADGRDCDSGLWLVYNLPLDLLTYQWREAVLGENAWTIALRDLAPYLALAGVVLLVPWLQFLLIQDAAEDE